MGGAALVFAVAPTSIRTSSDMQHSVVSLDVDIDYISGYVTVNGKCPEGQEITDSEECKKAGIATGFKKTFQDKDSEVPARLFRKGPRIASRQNDVQQKHSK